MAESNQPSTGFFNFNDDDSGEQNRWGHFQSDSIETLTANQHPSE